MCVFLSLSMHKAQIKKQYDLKDISEDLFAATYVQSAFEFKSWPVISGQDQSSLSLMNWGLIPRWVKDEKTALKLRTQTVNARIETVEEKPSFRQAVARNRCLVIADGFFEFREVNKQKYPYFIRLKGQEVFSMAGIFDEWAHPGTGEIVHSFSILTTSANPLMERIHNRKKRMPVILTKEDEKAWLDFSTPANSFEHPFPSEQMEAWTVSRLLTSRTEDRNVMEVLDKVHYPELVMADGLNI